MPALAHSRHFPCKVSYGHRSIKSTLHYMHIAKGLINYSENYTVKVATSRAPYTIMNLKFFFHSSYYI
jgi:hypothetical protein